MKRALRNIGRVLVVAVSCVAVLVVVAALRLMAGPIELEFLHARAQREIQTAGGPIRFATGKITLEWPGISQPVSLAAHDIKVIDQSGTVLGTIPSAALSFEPRSIVAGKFAPTTVVLQKPTLDADLRKGGLLRAMMNRDDAQPQARVAAAFIEQLLSEPDNDGLLGQLDTVIVEGARLTVRDSVSGLQWTTPDARARLKRDTTGVVIGAHARFTGTGDPITVSVSGNYSRDRSHITLESRLEGVRPSQFAELSPDTKLLRGLDLPLAGVLRVEASGAGEIRTVTAELVGNNGRLVLTDILPVAHPVQTFQAKVVVDLVQHTIKGLRVVGEFGPARLDVTGAGSIRDKDVQFAGRAELNGLPVDRLADYWPLGFAPGGRAWATQNISSGTADLGADFSLKGTLGALDQMALERVVGLLDYHDLRVRYMPDVVPLEAVSGTARYEADALRFEIVQGKSGALSVSGATVVMENLTGPSPQYAAITVPIDGTAGAVMEYLHQPKLGLLKSMLYDPKRVGGDASVTVSMRFPMVSTLTLGELNLKAESAVANFSLREALGKVDVTNGTMKLVYSGPEMRVSGHAKLDGHPFDIEWRELFGQRPAFRRRYEIKGTAPTSVLPKAGFVDVEPSITGPVGIDLSYQVAVNGTSEVNGRFDLKAAKADIPPLGWTKEPGTEGQASGVLRFAAGGKLSTIDFDGKGAGLAAKGQVRFAAENVLQQVTLQSLTLGRNDLSAEWRQTGNGMEVAVRGKSLEWSRVRHAIRQREANAKPSQASKPAPPTRVAVAVALDQILVERGSFGAMTGNIEILGDRITKADLSLPASGGSTFRIVPGSQGRTVKLNINNMGEMLKNAGWLDGLVGGWLAFDGRFEDGQAGAPLVGKLAMGQFRMERTANRRAGVGTLNGTIDSLDRAGDALQVYEILEGNIVKTGDVIDLKKGRTNGRSIGMTAQGTFDLGNDTVKLRGVVVPSFAFNNALSNVPLLGPLLTGGRDGGLFAITYRLEGPLDDPKSSINMMSALTPGGLRELFNSEGGGVDTDLTPNPEATRAP